MVNIGRMKKLLTILLLAVCAPAIWAQHLERYAPYDPLAKEPADFERYFDKWFKPVYPEKAEIFHKTGQGTYRLTINPQTGAVTEVKIVKSTGVKILDDAACVGFLQWKAKPRTIDHCTIPVSFRPPGEHTGSHIPW
jgi:TonB family protein